MVLTIWVCLFKLIISNRKLVGAPMKTEQIAEELNQIQITHAKAFSRLADMFTLNGETGVLIWLNQQQREVFAIDIIDHFGLTAGRVANIVKKPEQKG